MSYLESLFGLHGKTALVTGGATGIGRMAAEALVQAGARVLIASRKGEACEAVAAELNALDAPGTAEGFAGDVGTPDALDALVADVQVRTDRLHILMNNAGITWGEPIETFPLKQWERVMNVNVTAMFTLTRDLLPLLDAAATPEDPARIINVGSVMGTVPLAEGAYSYTISKAAVHHMTKVFAVEFAARHITANAIAPGPFPSRMTRFATESEEQRKAVGANVPLGRVGEPRDVGGTVVFLCGAGGAYISGAIVPLDGGMSVKPGIHLFENTK